MAATKDLADIDQYSVREWGEAQADRYLNQLEACFFRLAKNPLLGRECSTIRPGLRRIEHGTYGTCADCGARVPEGRLEARPEAARCVKCQGKWDRLRR